MAMPLERPDFARAARRLAASVGVGVRERRRFRRAPLIINGRMLDPLGREHDCRAADMSPGDIRIAAPILPDVGHRVVLYMEGFGRLEGAVARRCGETEVAIIFNQSHHKREKLAEALTWAINKAQLGLEDETQTIIRDGAQLARVELEDGGQIEGEVLDFSITGMTIKTARIAPPLGIWVRVGSVYGRVARTIEGGFAIDFEPGRTRFS